MSLGGLPEGWAAALVHHNQGRKPRNSVPEDVVDTVILTSEKYAGFNHSHLTEVLAEQEGIHLSRQDGKPPSQLPRPVQH